MSSMTAEAAYLVMGLIVVFAGWCRFRINERRFRRRTIAGGQQFPSYGAAVFTQWWEGLAMLLANGLMIFTIFCALWLAVGRYHGA